jgi:hypothetical protein
VRTQIARSVPRRKKRARRDGGRGYERSGSPSGRPSHRHNSQSGSRCRSPAMPNGRCRMHGGLSPGAPMGNRNAFKHGRYTAEGPRGERRGRPSRQGYHQRCFAGPERQARREHGRRDRGGLAGLDRRAPHSWTFFLAGSLRASGPKLALACASTSTSRATAVLVRQVLGAIEIIDGKLEEFPASKEGERQISW